MADYENKGKENESCVDSVSDYALGLDSVSRERYDRKLELFDGRFKVPDPYVLKDNEWSLEVTRRFAPKTFPPWSFPP